MLPYKIGDIIIFKAEDDWLSKAIALLSDSDVSHAAMVYSEDSIVEVGAYGIGVNKTEIADGDAVYVMRMQGEPDSAPLIQSADHYLSTGVRYDFSGLILLAGLLVYKKLPNASGVLSVSQRILSAAVSKLDQYINQLGKKSGAPAMVCSQLVYQIYKDCGKKYQILIENGTFSCKNGIDGDTDGITLANLDLKYSSDLTTPFFNTNTDGEPEDEEALARELYEVLSEVKNAPSFEFIMDQENVLSNNLLRNTVQHARHFLSRLEHFLKKAHIKTSPEALFVTPADLAYHGVNLNQIGTLDIERIL